MRRSAALIALLAAGAAAGAMPTAPGRYDAELCVATRPQAAPSCGAAEVEVTPARISVRVADIVYRLALRTAQLDVETMHGRIADRRVQRCLRLGRHDPALQRRRQGRPLRGADRRAPDCGALGRAVLHEHLRDRSQASSPLSVRRRDRRRRR